MKKFLTTAMLVAATTLATNVLASETGGHSGEFDRHHVGINLGATHAESDTNFTFGFEYAYKLNKKWGVGAGYERTNDAHHGQGVAVWTGMLFYNLSEHVKLGIGGGQEMTHDEDEGLFRLSAAYDYHIEEYDFAIAPNVAVDFVGGEESYLFGVAFVKSF